MKPKRRQKGIPNSISDLTNDIDEAYTKLGTPKKYNNRKVEIDGYKFDSKLEAKFYLKLKALLESGEIVNLIVHPKYLLQEDFVKRGNHFNPIYYVADFQVEYPDGTIKVYDTKGIKTDVYKLKRKLFEYRYQNLEIEEVKKC